MSSCVLRSSLPLLFSLPQLVRYSTPRPCPFLYALSIFCRRAGGGDPARTQQHRFRRRQTHQAEGHSPPHRVARVQDKGKAHSSLPQASRMFARTGKCNRSPCKFLHEAPAASACSPSSPARMEEGCGSVAAVVGGSRTLSLRAVLPAGGNRGGDGGGGAGSGSG